MIREAVLQHIMEVRKVSQLAYLARREGRPTRLHVSDLGHCPRKAYLRMQGAEMTHPFDDYVKEIMHAGLVWESETRIALRAAYGDASMKSEVSVENEMWSGRIDFMLPGNVIVEHKATSPVNFVRKDRLPYVFHCLQVLGYANLLPQTFVAPATKLYYRSWANWAELEVWQNGSDIEWEGQINGRYKNGEFLGTNVLQEMALLEGFWEAFWRDGTLPPRYDTPFTKQFGCCRVTKKGAYPSCTYFGLCWPQMAYLKGPFDPKEWSDVGMDPR